jgi:hypothetical protein
MSDPREDDYFDQDEPPRRHKPACWCFPNNKGEIPGVCPGPSRCPYSGFHDDEDKNDND